MSGKIMKGILIYGPDKRKDEPIYKIPFETVKGDLDPINKALAEAINCAEKDGYPKPEGAVIDRRGLYVKKLARDAEDKEICPDIHIEEVKENV